MSIWALAGRPAINITAGYARIAGTAGALTAGNYIDTDYKSMYNPHAGLTTYTHKRNNTSKTLLPKGNRMPKKTSRRTKRPRRNLRRYRRRKNSIIPFQVVPKSRLVKMRLCERILLTGTTGATGVANTYFNSLQDPLVASGTAQPYYYDQIKTMYRSATVLGAKYNVTFHNTSSTVPAVVGLYLMPWDNSTGITSYEYFREISAKGKQRVLSSDIDTCHMVLKVSTRKHFGVTNVKDNSELLSDIENDTDPTKVGMVTILSQALDQSSTSTVEAIVTIEQIVLLQHPYQPARSVDV